MNKFCKNCGLVFTGNKNRKFCTRGCSSSHNNKLREKQSKLEICKKCGSKFDCAPILNGKRHSSYGRLFCFECSPFGGHNTRDLTIEENDGLSSKERKVLNQLNKIDWNPVQEFYDAGNSLKMVLEKFKLSNWIVGLARQNGRLKTRTLKEAMKVAKDKGRRELTDVQRLAISEKKKAFFKKYPEKHPRRLLANNRVKMSYPEKIVFDFLTDKGIKFEHEKFIKPYYVDFLLPDNVILEVDGRYWHDATKDKIRDEALNKLGFVVNRVSATDVIKSDLAVLLKNIINFVV